MKRRNFVKWGALALFHALAFSGSFSFGAGRVDLRPNIMLLMTDDQSLDTVSAYGRHPFAATPNLDQLAAEGVRIEKAFCQSPQCVTSSRSILTGQYPHHNGVYTFERSHCETEFFRPGYTHMLRHEKGIYLCTGR